MTQPICPYCSQGLKIKWLGSEAHCHYCGNVIRSRDDATHEPAPDSRGGPLAEQPESTPAAPGVVSKTISVSRKGRKSWELAIIPLVLFGIALVWADFWFRKAAAVVVPQTFKVIVTPEGDIIRPSDQEKATYGTIGVLGFLVLTGIGTACGLVE